MPAVSVGSLPANEVVIVPAKSASSANEAANSFYVSNAAGAASTISTHAVFVPSVDKNCPALPD